MDGKAIETVNVNNDIVREMERLNYENLMLTTVIDRYIEGHPNDADAGENKTLRSLMGQLTDVIASQEILKQAISTTMVPEDLRSDEYEWRLDFETGVLAIMEK